MVAKLAGIGDEARNLVLRSHRNGLSTIVLSQQDPLLVRWEVRCGHWQQFRRCEICEMEAWSENRKE
jgi:hypothetical protein